MVAKKTELLLCVYLTDEERQKDIMDKEAEGYRVIKEGAASFDEITVQHLQEFKSGEIYLYANFERIM